MDEADWDDLFHVLGDVHRRRLLLALLEDDSRSEPVQVPEDVHVGERTLENLQIEMIHHHLPLLANAGYVTWDEENHRVERGPGFAEIRPVLELLLENRDELPMGLV